MFEAKTQGGPPWDSLRYRIKLMERDCAEMEARMAEDFGRDFHDAIYEEARNSGIPAHVQELLSQANILTFKKSSGRQTIFEMQLSTRSKAGRIVATWEFGTVRAVPYKIVPRYKKVLAWYDPSAKPNKKGKGPDKDGMVYRAWVIIDKAIEPNRFIWKAYIKTLEKYKKLFGEANHDLIQKRSIRGTQLSREQAVSARAGRGGVSRGVYQEQRRPLRMADLYATYGTPDLGDIGD